MQVNISCHPDRKAVIGCNSESCAHILKIAGTKSGQPIASPIVEHSIISSEIMLKKCVQTEALHVER